MEKNKQLKNSIIKELILDTEYADYLCEQNLGDMDMIDLVCCAPVPLTRKAEMLKSLSAYQGETEKLFSYKTYYDEVQKAIDDLKLNEGEIYLCIGKTSDYGEETQLEAFPSKSLDHVYSIVREEFYDAIHYNFDDYCDWGEYCDWYELEKWHTATEEEIKRARTLRGDMTKNPAYTYTFIKDEICYFDNFRLRWNNPKEYKIKEKFSLLYSGSSLNLPTPYKEGDILEVDGTPFAPKTRVVVLNNACKTDCCDPQCMYLTENGGVDAGALKRSHIYKNAPYDNISPLYSVKRYTGELREDESILKNVSDYVKDDRERGDKIYGIVTRNEKTEGDSNLDVLRKLILKK